MKLLLSFSYLFLAVSAGTRNSKTTLEDIERDYITTQKRTKLTPPPAPAAKSPTQFGFVPTKTLADYIQKEPRINYASQYQVGEYQQPLGARQSFGGLQDKAPQKYSTIPQKYNAISQKYSTAPQKYGATYSPQAPQAYYVPQAQNQYQYFENVPYVADNNLGQQVGQQYLTSPYLYLPQYQGSSSSVQNVVDTKGLLQYLSYLPTNAVPSAEQSQNYENVVYTVGDDQTQYQNPEEAQSYNTLQYSQKEETSQYAQPESVISQNEQPAQYAQQGESAQYVQTGESAQYGQPENNYNNAEVVIRREPKSLLDSYVPSYLQLQYYRQTQHQNTIQDNQHFGKSHRNSYRPGGAKSFTNYNHRPSLQKH
ncbi:hypothetical protein JTB14_012124 [Gonioctena quinquepunctata]|nr:hypothetical protein JTB14_012124 [Gonioctena quinquepunctata]